MSIDPPDYELAEGISYLRIGNRIKCLLNKTSRNTAKVRVDENASPAFRKACNVLNELLGKSTKDFPSTPEQQEPYFQACEEIIVEGMDLIDEKNPSPGDRLWSIYYAMSEIIPDVGVNAISEGVNPSPASIGRKDAKETGKADAVASSCLFDDDTAQGVRSLRVGYRIKNLLDAPSLVYPKMEIEEENTPTYLDACAKLNELIDKRINGFPSTPEQQASYRLASRKIINEGIEFIAKKSSSGADRIRRFIAQESNKLPDSGVNHDPAADHPRLKALWRRTKEEITKRAPEFIVGAATGSIVRFLFTSAAVAVVGGSAPVLLIASGAGAVTGGILSAWRASKQMSQEEKDKAKGLWGWKTKAFVSGAVVGAMGGALGGALADFANHAFMAAPSVTGGSLTHPAGLMGSSTVTHPGALPTLTNPLETAGLPKVAQHVSETAVHPAITQHVSETAVHQVTGADPVPVLNPVVKVSANTPKFGVNGWSKGCWDMAVRDRLSGWWCGVLLNHGVPVP